MNVVNDGQSIADVLLREVSLDPPALANAALVIFRLLTASILGGLLGWERGQAGKEAGMRTHMLVALGSALFILSAFQTGMAAADVSRVIQGVATGIGFIGGGVILKLSQERLILGVTTAATIWMTAAVGMAAGAGRFWTALLGTLLALVILHFLLPLEDYLTGRPTMPKPGDGVGKRSGKGRDNKNL